MKRLLIIFGLLLCMYKNASADSFDDWVTFMKNGNVSGVSHLLNNSVELTILDNEGVYSRQQSEMMIKNFIQQHPPQNISIQHRGQSNLGARYAIAIYESSGNRYRAYIFIKNSGTGMLIHELRIERE